MTYLDHAASTPMRPEAIAAMLPFLADHPANPSGGHHAARAAKTALEAAREDVADVLGCAPREVVFAASGSASDNLAVKGAAWAARQPDGASGGVIVSAIEHKAVLAAAHRLSDEGHRTTEIAADASGAVDLDELTRALDALDGSVAVVSVMTVNNETGVVQPLADVESLVRAHAPSARLHTDAVQAPQWLDVGRVAAGFDLVSLSGHKFGGPKGVGVLVCRDGVELTPLVEGGGHEWGLWAGTQNVAGIVAFAAALRTTHEQRADETARIAALRDRLEAALVDRVGGVSVNGDRERRVEGALHVAIDGVEAETLLVALDAVGVCAASGSACSSGAIEPSHVLLAMGMDAVRARSSIRISFGWASTDADVEDAIDRIPAVVARLRERAA